MPNKPSDAHGEAREFFDRIAEDYKRRSEVAVYNVSSLSFKRRQGIVADLVAETPDGGTVLDYGMGPAVFGPAAAKRGLRYIGIDISPKMVELAEAMNLPGAEYHVGDLELLGRFRGTADTVLLIGLIDYLDDPATGLRRLAECVKPGGRIVLSFRNHRSLPRWMRNSAKAVWRAVRGGGSEESTAFAAPVLENSFVPGRDLVPVLRDAGFRRFEVRYLDCSPIFFNLPLVRALWNLGYNLDRFMARPSTSFLCASGVLIGSAKE